MLFIFLKIGLSSSVYFLRMPNHSSHFPTQTAFVVFLRVTSEVKTEGPRVQLGGLSRVENLAEDGADARHHACPSFTVGE